MLALLLLTSLRHCLPAAGFIFHTIRSSDYSPEMSAGQKLALICRLRLCFLARQTRGEKQAFVK